MHNLNNNNFDFLENDFPENEKQTGEKSRKALLGK